MGMEEKSLEQELLGNTQHQSSKSYVPRCWLFLQHVKFSVPKKVIFACDVLNGVSEEIWPRLKRLLWLQG